MASSLDNIVVFTIGRMNPPTPGHMAVIEKMIERAANFGQTKIGIVLSHSQDIPKNPFSCNEKRTILLSGMIQALQEQMKRKTYNPPISHESIERIDPIIICMDDLTPAIFGKHPILKSVNLLLSKYGYPENPIEKMILIIGEDRASSYDWLKESFRKRTPLIPVEIEALSRPEGAISATYMRELAATGNWGEFLRIMQTTGLDESIIQQLYDELRTRLKKGGRKTRKQTRRGKTRRKRSKRSKKTKKMTLRRHY